MRQQSKYFRHLTVALAGALVASLAFGATRVKLQPAPGATLKISGTSSIHDWHVETKQIGGGIELDDQEFESLRLGSVPSVKVQVGVKSLKSGKGGMDDVMYKALKADKFPTITYEMTVANAHGDPAATGGMFNTKGRLTVAGVTKEVPIHVTLKRLAADTLEVTGTAPLKMTQFGIKPPTAMLGTIKSGDDVKVTFRWVVKRG